MICDTTAGKLCSGDQLCLVVSCQLEASEAGKIILTLVSHLQAVRAVLSEENFSGHKCTMTGVAGDRALSQLVYLAGNYRNSLAAGKNPNEVMVEGGRIRVSYHGKTVKVANLEEALARAWEEPVDWFNEFTDDCDGWIGGVAEEHLHVVHEYKAFIEESRPKLDSLHLDSKRKAKGKAKGKAKAKARSRSPSPAPKSSM
eukprot:TRINITY_DN95199_c0_g1_i1.p1 TRINITY_DN95199_c0_g1~~TRINITY_DN95199_c0_g1_i1.p1  ORF type:complete len:200 (+),score=19.97 TRINITY_DN95199_c0_g1_i1:363-962(+)